MKMMLSSLILLSGLSFATVACSPAEESVKTEEPVPSPDPEPTPEPQPGNGRTLVVYFSFARIPPKVLQKAL